MKTMMKTATLCASLLVALTACEPKEKIVDRNHIVAEQSMTSDALTDSAEQLVSPYNFPLADRVLDMALANDPTNMKAQFLKTFIKRMVVFKGILKRMQPIADANGNGANLRQSIKKLPESPLKSFLLDNAGKSDIKDADDVQSFLVEYRNAVNDLRTFVKKNPGLDITINLNPHMFADRINQNLTESCSVTQLPDGGGMDVQCDTANMARVKLEYADFNVLAQEAAGEVLYLGLLTSYSVKGLDKLFNDMDKQKVIGQKEVIRRIEGTATAAKLRADHSLGLVKEIGADLSAAMKYAMQYQDRLCPRPEFGQYNIAQRPGYLFSKGFCVQDANQAQTQLAMFDELLSGIVYRDMEDADGFMITVRIDSLALFNRPVVDLRTLFPATFSACGQASSLRDKTFGGTFPDGNAETFLIKKSCE